ncbi:MAG: hypothetical protein KDJ36_02070 [Hyphomicrobiaceae bacterium]|nr:hypothetical protein [Hyphomicrobiaceae bacterium]
MAKKPSKGKKTGTVVTLMRTRLTTIQSKDEFLTAPLGLQIGQGGASHLYELKPTLQSRRVAKIYKDDYRADKGINAATKLIAMAGRHHELTSRLPFVLWPDELVLSSRAMTLSAVADAVLGFTMPPLPDNTINLYTLLKQPKYRRHFQGDATIRLAARLAEHIALLHRESIVLCDLNPKNIHVSTNLEHLTFIDADGYQVGFSGVVYPSRGVTEGYASPAAIANFKTNPLALRTPAEDDFVLAILIFQLLVDRAHPFATGPLFAEHPNASHNDNIVDRRFAFANPARFKPDEDALAQYRRLATPLKAAFHRTFLTSRPLTAEQWAKLLPSHFMKHMAANPTPEPTAAQIQAIGQPAAPPPPAQPRPAPSRAPHVQRTPSRPIPPVTPGPQASASPQGSAPPVSPSIQVRRRAVIATAALGLPAGFIAGSLLLNSPSAPTSFEVSPRVSQILAELPENLDTAHAILKSRKTR